VLQLFKYLATKGLLGSSTTSLLHSAGTSKIEEGWVPFVNCKKVKEVLSVLNFKRNLIL